jgi:xanthosine utilization system XapX-like protein
MKAGLCVGVVISFINDSVQSPHLLMHIEEWFGILLGNIVNA